MNPKWIITAFLALAASLDEDGETQERVYDVAVSGDRKIGQNGGCKQSIGNTVDVKESNLEKHHRRSRPDRRLERPGIRPQIKSILLRTGHQISDAVRFGIKLPDDVNMTTQERANTLPI